MVNVSSNAHYGGTINFDDLQGYRGMPAYSNSKLANVLFTYELARRLEGTAITSNALHPGFVATNIGVSNYGVLGRIVKKIINLQAIDVEAGTKTNIYLASSPEVAGVSGKYFTRQQVRKSSDESYDAAVAGRLWQLSAEMTAVPAAS